MRAVARWRKRRRRLLSRRAALGLADHCVRRWEEDALVAVLPVHDVRRAALVAVDLDDPAMAVPVALMPALDYELVSDRCFHGSASPALPTRFVRHPVQRCSAPHRPVTPGHDLGNYRSRTVA